MSNQDSKANMTYNGPNPDHPGGSKIKTDKVIPEKPGAIAADSLAADSSRSGGAFSHNINSEPLGVSGSNSTLANKDISGAETLEPTDVASSRKENRGGYPDAIAASGQGFSDGKYGNVAGEGKNRDKVGSAESGKGNAEAHAHQGGGSGTGQLHHRDRCGGEEHQAHHKLYHHEHHQQHHDQHHAGQAQQSDNSATTGAGRSSGGFTTSQPIREGVLTNAQHLGGSPSTPTGNGSTAPSYVNPVLAGADINSGAGKMHGKNITEIGKDEKFQDEGKRDENSQSEDRQAVKNFETSHSMRDVGNDSGAQESYTRENAGIRYSALEDEGAK